MARLTLIAVAAALAACGRMSPGPDGANGKPPARPLILTPQDVLTVQAGSPASGPIVTGSIQPGRRADLRVEVPAVVLQVLKENGEPVKKGDLLVRLDDTAIRDSLASAQEAVRAARQAHDQAQRQCERLKTLRASGMASAQQLDDAEMRRDNAQSDMAAAKARLASAQQQLQRTEVRAPFDGIVSDRKVSAGDTAAVGKELVKVVDPASMRFEGFVAAGKAGGVMAGQKVVFRVNGYGDQVFDGVVKRIDPSADPTTRQVAVLVAFGKDARPRLAGLYAEGRIEDGRGESVMLPEAALILGGGKAHAWRVQGKLIEAVDVVIGKRDPRRGELSITSGLAPGDRIIRHPGSGLKDGQKIDMTNLAVVEK